MSQEEQCRDTLLAMEGVAIGSFHDSQTVLIEAVDWRVRRGEFWVVAGHHGTGKTDLLLTAAGLMESVRGTCTLHGQVQPGLEPEVSGARLKTGLVFNEARLLNQLTLGGNVRLPLCYHRGLNEVEAAEHVRPLLEATELSQMEEHAPDTVGRPWRLRTALARALALGPELLLLDEPLAGLDTRHTLWWVEFLRKLHGGQVRPPTAGSVGLGQQVGEVFSGQAAGMEAPNAHSAVSTGMTLVVSSGTLDPWCDLATHCAVLEGGRFNVRGLLREAMQAGDGTLREFSGFPRATFDRPPAI